MPRFKDPGTAAMEASNPLRNDEVASFVTSPSPEPSAPSLFDPPAMGAGMIGESPAGYRVSWLPENPRPSTRNSSRSRLSGSFRPQRKRKRTRQKSPRNTAPLWSCASHQCSRLRQPARNG
jgi:hypothetical protein